MASDCERCNGDGVINGAIEDLPCPNCRDVCQWCNSEYDDGEPLGDAGFSVCRPCIRDMADYKEDVAYQLHISHAVRELEGGGDEFLADVDDAIASVFEEYGFTHPDGEFDVREPEYGEVGE